MDAIFILTIFHLQKLQQEQHPYPGKSFFIPNNIPPRSASAIDTIYFLSATLTWENIFLGNHRVCFRWLFFTRPQAFPAQAQLRKSFPAYDRQQLI